MTGRRREAVEALEALGRGTAIGFALLLVAAAAALAVGDQGLAEQLATGAYYSLVVSVVSLLAAEALSPGEAGGRSA